jgi:2-polyprenyl-3-methyl-5-hydroxy-6-metoxy-1,4-benzoquinol methylase
VDHCRVCGMELFSEPLLEWPNMPRAAQYLPEAQALATETGVDLVVRQCSGCGLVQLWGEPVPYYRDVIRAAGISSEMRAFRAQQFADFLEQYSLRGQRVLEVGCGRGEYLTIMQEVGAKAYGLEHLPESVVACRQQGLAVQEGFMEGADTRLPEAPFEAFFTLNFLEHQPTPKNFLRGIWHNLVPQGIGLVEVPNFDMMLRQRLFSEFTTDHLLYFTAETLATTLEVSGFEVLDSRVVWHDYILSAIVRKRTALDASEFARYPEKLKAQLNAYLAGFAPGEVAVWGAGHQAFAVLALAELGGKIRYVVDSAPFKQNRFTPATHLPIVPPQTLETDPVAAVIVMAAGYSDEVAATLRDRYPKVQVALLRDYGLQTLPANA